MNANRMRRSSSQKKKEMKLSKLSLFVTLVLNATQSQPHKSWRRSMPAANFSQTTDRHIDIRSFIPCHFILHLTHCRYLLCCLGCGLGQDRIGSSETRAEWTHEIHPTIHPRSKQASDSNLHVRLIQSYHPNHNAAHQNNNGKQRWQQQHTKEATKKACCWQQVLKSVSSYIKSLAPPCGPLINLPFIHFIIRNSPGIFHSSQSTTPIHENYPGYPTPKTTT